MNTDLRKPSPGPIPAIALYTYGTATGLTPEQIALAVRRGREERALVASRMLAGAVRALAALGRGLRALGAGIAKAQRRRAANAIALQMNRHLLADINLTPGQVRAMTVGALSEPVGVRSSAAARVETDPAPAPARPERLAA